MYFVLCIIVGLVCGFIAKSIAESRGMEGGFWWGFFLSVIGIIVVAVRPNDKKESSYTPSYSSENRSTNSKSVANEGEWTCLCGRVNAGYVGTCTCGKSKSDVLHIRKMNEEAEKKERLMDEDSIKFENLKKLKELLDIGAITPEEYNEKKKQYL